MGFICSVLLTAGRILVVELPIVVALEEVGLLRVGPRDGGVDVVGQTLIKRLVMVIVRWRMKLTGVRYVS